MLLPSVSLRYFFFRKYRPLLVMFNGGTERGQAGLRCSTKGTTLLIRPVFSVQQRKDSIRPRRSFRWKSSRAWDQSEFAVNTRTERLRVRIMWQSFGSRD